MAKKVVLMCEKCKEEKEHWDNRETKRDKQPDYKCIDCGKGIWISKQNNPTPKPVESKASKTSSAGNSAKYSGKMNPSYYGAWAKDLAIASVEKKLNLDDLVEAFSISLGKLEEILNKGVVEPSREVTSDPQDSTPEPTDEPEVEASTEVSEDFNVDDLDI